MENLSPASPPGSEARRCEVLALYDAHASILFRFVLSTCGNADVACDVVQQVFLKLLSAPAASLRPLTRESLLAEARILLDRHIEENRSVADFASPGPHRPPADPLRAVAAEEFRRRVRHLASPRELQILALRGEGLSYNEIARVLDISIGTVGSLLARVIRKLRRHLTAPYIL